MVDPKAPEPAEFSWPWVVCPSWVGAASLWAWNSVKCLTNLVNGILIKKVFNQPWLVTPLTAKYTALESPLTCCKNPLLLYRKSFKLPILSCVLFWTLVKATPFVFNTNEAGNLGSNLLTWLIIAWNNEVWVKLPPTTFTNKFLNLVLKSPSTFEVPLIEVLGVAPTVGASASNSIFGPGSLSKH
ncbi:hypothetical protein K6989_02505 [Mycoplasmopsis synoviae]|uniref:hypothetical protein n=1 Tax=Mycoplasmopsis synoviae TaxID=2109 RepID=UPI001CE222E9|nr:hypothetical protein [Mycoplasmopsis synoviae]UBX97240.1 hypothetical protein K6989_02505 [Mycoplasmopsis synoviae]